MQKEIRKYDVVIVGGGVVGTALLYVLARYTNIKRIALIEKRSEMGELNSKSKNNSQTLHFGDIETHYTLQKAKEVQYAAGLLKHFLLQSELGEGLYKKTNKMVLAVGEPQVQELRDRFQLIQSTYPGIQLLDREEIAQLEPNVIAGRNENEVVSALFNPDGFMVDFGALSKRFVELAKTQKDKAVDIFTNTEVKKIWHDAVSNEEVISTSQGNFRAKAVEVAAAGYSLYFAKQYGLGKNWALANIVGNFYFTQKLLQGKVYRMQIPGLPFAAVHGDPDVRDDAITRFGPTAKAVLMLDRERYASVKDYFSFLGWNIQKYIALLAVVREPIVVKYMALNVLYDFPLIGKHLFLKELRKIVPTLRAKDLHRARREGGVRPQIIDVEKRKTVLGEGKLYGEKIIFNVTPSPGASVCLGSAEVDAKKIVEMLGGEAMFQEDKFRGNLIRE